MEGQGGVLGWSSVCVYVRAHICGYMHVYVGVCMHLCMYVCVHIYNMCMCVSV